MRRSRSRWLIAVAVVALASCAFEDGEPWGRAQFSLEASFDPPDSRLEDGRLRTAKDYRVELDEVAVTFAAAEVEVATSGELASFDPANPPPGYSLCHNGHCHAADGSLVDYEDIEIEQSGGDFVVAQTIERSVGLGAQPEAVDLRECSGDCRLERGELGIARLRISELRLVGTVTDVRDRLREPLELDVELQIDTAIESPVSGTIAPGEPGLAVVELDFRLPPDFLDDVDFAEGAVDPESIEITDALDVNVEMHSL